MKNWWAKVKVFLLLHLKLRYYEKATKLEKTAVLLSSVKISGRFLSNFCGLFRKAEVYLTKNHAYKILFRIKNLKL